MPKNVFNILAPAGGLYKRRSYQEDPPFTTPDCDNVWLDDTIDGRERVGARPGFASVGASTGSAIVRMIASVRWVDTIPTIRKETLVAVVGSTIYYSTDNGTTWDPAAGSLTSGLNHGPMTAASLHQKLYIGDTTEPVVFDPSTNTWQDMSSEANYVAPPGGAIQGCMIAVAYRDRLLLTGDVTAGEEQRWYMSRLGEPADWDTDETDVLSAVSSQTSNAGQLGEQINCAIPHGDDCIIFGCTDSIWTLRSDPNFGGTLDNLSQRIGIVGRNAWCRSPEGWLFFLTQDGVMAMPPGCGDTPRSISRERLPDDLLFVDAMDNASGAFQNMWVSMAYDVRFRGVHLWVSDYTVNDPSTSTHYWLDTKQVLTQDAGNVASFWPMSVASDLDVFATHEYENLGSTTQSDVILGGRSGDYRVLDNSVDCEQVSYVDVGPLSTTGRQGSYLDGRLDQLNAVLANTSGNVTFEIRTGESPEAAFDGAIIRSGTWTKQHSLVRPRVRDPYFVIRLKTTASASAWAFENITALTEQAGKMRYQS